MIERRVVLLVQLPIPPPGMQPVLGNIPLAAGYLKLYAARQGLDKSYDIQILAPSLANRLGDQGLVEAVLARRPWLVGFTCYLWNVDRTLWIAERLKQQRPDVRILLGGPEITPDNAWVLRHPAVDFAVPGEGEQAFAELLARVGEGAEPARLLSHRPPLASLDPVSSPYVEGMLDLGDERTMFLETARGCACKCKFCYYPKNYASQYFLSPPQIEANLQYAAAQGATEVVLLDPTLNQRPDFAGFLGLLARGNAQRQFTYSGELRAERLSAAEVRLLRDANFAEVEVGLQSTDPTAQARMGRRISPEAFARGARALADAGIRVRTDLIVGLPGDTPDSVRRSIDFLLRTQAFTETQVFNLSILPGTAFRHEAADLGLVYQERPPYYVLQTPTLRLEDIYRLMEEAQEALGVDFDPLAPPQLDLPMSGERPVRLVKIDLDTSGPDLPSPGHRAQAMTLWLRSADFLQQHGAAAALIEQVLQENPHTTLDVVIEPARQPARLPVSLLERLLAACYKSSSYLDRYYSLHLGQRRGAKRLIVLLPQAERSRVADSWIEEAGQCATLMWRD